ncbi:hypothetical protein [Nocardioides plantarum]|uniref:Transcriptional regulator, TetR family n=1 Tax=Nocardioides plantarum TaxID=29299 RepID=A0ABV5K574_9ACTN|nr:hypothetical protein [Nocardioides plantarum]
MKRFEKLAAQHQLLAEAAFAVVRRDGPGSLSRRGLAAELGASEAMARRVLAEHVRLPALAAQECEARRRRIGRRRSGVDLLLPVTEGAEVDVEVVWLRLVLLHATVGASTDAPHLAERYQLSVHDRGVSLPAPPDRGREDREADREVLAPYLADHAAERAGLVSRLTGGRPELADAVHALADGLVLAVCTGRLSPDAARTVLTDHLDRLTSTPTCGG